MTLTDTLDQALADTNQEFGAAGNSSFSRSWPNLQLGWDSTSLGALKTCPRLYQLTIIEGWTGLLDNPHLRFGLLFHSACEAYDKARAIDGLEHEEALLLAIRVALVGSWDSDPGRPWLSTEPTKSRDTLLRSLVWYLDFFQNDSLQTLILPDGTPAVELSFRFPLSDLLDGTGAEFRAPTGEEYLFCGHLDKGVLWNDQIWIVDKKTTKGALDDRYFANYAPDNQVSGYSVAGLIVFKEEVAGLIIDGIQIMVNGTRFRRQAIGRSTAQLEEWLTDLQHYLRQAEGFAANSYWPMNDKSCGLYGGCTFRSICGAEPALRPTLLGSNFSRRTWDPLQPR